MLRKAKDSAPEVAAVAVAIPQPVNDRPEVQQAAQDLAQARERLAQAEQELAVAGQGVEDAERLASEVWTGTEPPATLASAHVRRATAQSLVRVALAGLQAAQGRFQPARARAQQRYREELEQAERELVAALDRALLEAGRINAQLAQLHQAACGSLGSGHGSGVWSKVFGPLAPDLWGRVPASVQAWREPLRKYGMLPAEGDDQDWEAVCRPLRPRRWCSPRSPRRSRRRSARAGRSGTRTEVCSPSGCADGRVDPGGGVHSFPGIRASGRAVSGRAARPWCLQWTHGAA